MKYDLFQVAVKGLVFDKEERLLLMKSQNGEWDLPGGRINYGENFVEALQRECLEEVGVECKVVDENPKFVFMGRNTLGAWRINICFLIELNIAMFTISDENTEYNFFNKNELSEINISPHLNKLKELL